MRPDTQIYADWLKLPPEIWISIFNSLDKNSQKNAFEVCRLFHQWVGNLMNFNAYKSTRSAGYTGSYEKFTADIKSASKILSCISVDTALGKKLQTLANANIAIAETAFFHPRFHSNFIENKRLIAEVDQLIRGLQESGQMWLISICAMQMATLPFFQGKEELMNKSSFQKFAKTQDYQYLEARDCSMMEHIVSKAEVKDRLWSHIFDTDELRQSVQFKAGSAFFYPPSSSVINSLSEDKALLFKNTQEEIQRFLTILCRLFLNLALSPGNSQIDPCDSMAQVEALITLGAQLTHEELVSISRWDHYFSGYTPN